MKPLRLALAALILASPLFAQNESGVSLTIFADCVWNREFAKPAQSQRQAGADSSVRPDGISGKT
jgi:hypothetical protein